MAIYLRSESPNYYYRFMVDGRKFAGCTYTANKIEATAYEAKKRAELTLEKGATDREKILKINQLKREVNTVAIPLATAFDVAMKKPTKKKASAAQVESNREYFSDFVAFIAGEFPAVKSADQVTRDMAEAYYHRLTTVGRYSKITFFRDGKTSEHRTATNRPLSANSVKKYIGIGKRVFAVLSRADNMVENPFVEIETPESDAKRRECFTIDQIKEMIVKADATGDAICKHLIIMGLYTGLRKTDMMNLKWSDIKKMKLIELETGKTGYRVAIPVHPELLKHLKSLPKTSEYVFPEIAEVNMTDDKLSKHFKRFLEIEMEYVTTVKGASRDVSILDIHSLRHSCAFYLGMTGTPLPVAQSILGHLTPELTRHYMSHSSASATEAAIARMPSIG